MALTGIVVDKNGKELSDEELRRKVIDVQNYYDIVIPIRNRLNKCSMSKNNKYV